MGCKLIITAVICCLIASAAQNRRAPRPAEAQAVTQAIVDEIYDYDRASQFAYVGVPVKGGSAVRLAVYISPVADGTGQVIYKYMPFGEVVRRFALKTDGTAELFGDPSVKFPFPATQPNTRTIYLDDQDVCRMRSTWQKTTVEVALKPDESAVAAAAQRQQIRTGFSFRLDGKSDRRLK